MAIIGKTVMTNVGDVEKLEPSCTAGINVKWSFHIGKQSGDSSVLNKDRLSHIMEYLSAIKRKILDIGKNTNLENIMIIESRNKNPHTVYFPFM